MSNTLFYIHDPMCSWCYAFQDALTVLEKQLPSEVSFKKLVGGLAPDTKAVMPEDLQKKIQHTWRRIEQTVPHVRFNHDFWVMNTPIRSTYPACRAVLAASKQGIEYEDSMIRAIQNAYYRHAKNPSLPSVLLECAADIGLNRQQFASDWVSDEIENELQDQIGLCRQLGVNSYPSLRLRQHQHIYSIPVDYLDFFPMLDAIIHRIKAAL